MKRRQLDEIEPEAVAPLASAELRRLGIAAGAGVRVTARRGMIELKARIDGNVTAGRLFVPFCCAETAANILTNPQLDPFGKIPEFKFCAAKVEAVEARAAAE
jgi:formate dehydrogenase major subunit